MYARGVGSLQDDTPSLTIIAREQEQLRQQEEAAAREQARLEEERESVRLVAAFEKGKRKGQGGKQRPRRAMVRVKESPGPETVVKKNRSLLARARETARTA